MATLQMQHRDGATLFRPQQGLMGGMWFTLQDVRREGSRARYVALESPESTHRIFRQADGGRWFYRFRKSELRTLEIAALERQLSAAQYTAPEGRSSAR